MWCDLKAEAERRQREEEALAEEATRQRMARRRQAEALQDSSDANGRRVAIEGLGTIVVRMGVDTNLDADVPAGTVVMEGLTVEVVDRPDSERDEAGACWRPCVAFVSA